MYISAASALQMQGANLRLTYKLARICNKAGEDDVAAEMCKLFLHGSLQEERAKEGERVEERHPRWTRGIEAFQEDNWQAVLVQRQVSYLNMNDAPPFYSLNYARHLKFPI